jgi:hypothetical protein
MQSAERERKLRPQPSNIEVMITVGGTCIAIAGAVTFDWLFRQVAPARIAWAEGWTMIGYALLVGIPLGRY